MKVLIFRVSGGGVDFTDFAGKGNYAGTLCNTLRKEIEEETGLILESLEEGFSLIPAWLCDVPDSKSDLAFVTIIIFDDHLIATAEYRDMLERGILRFIPIEDLLGGKNPLEFISTRMEYMIMQAAKKVYKEK